jgi:Domain of unknown function (DUF4389)
VDTAFPSTPPYPATFDVERAERVANWRPLVHWLLVIPHIIVLYFVGLVAEVVAFIAWFVILFTGKLPESFAGLIALYVRYNNRVTAYGMFMREEYPPFTFETTAPDPGDDQGVWTNFVPALEGRNRLTTAFRFILVIPQYIVLVFLGIAAGVAWFIAFFAVLFTGNWPEGLRQFVVGVLRWATRVTAYALLLTDEYPPFSLD